MTQTFSITRKGANSIKFKKILDRYFEHNKKYIEKFDYQDAIFGYTEMANVAALSNAAWELGYISMVEYQDSKYVGKNLKKNKKKKYKNGRVDLYIANDEDEFICEAKQCFTRGSVVDTNRVNKFFNAAYEDVCRSTKNVNDNKLDGYGIVFVVHLSRKNEKNKESLKLQINGLKKSLSKIYSDGFECAKKNKLKSVDGYGYYFPKIPIKNWTQSGDHKLLGVSVLLKRVEDE